MSSTPRYMMSARRLLDIVIATLGLLVMAPVLLVVCVAIWLEYGRPLFFSQVRIGRDGKPFRIHKFRKFRNECGSHGCRVSVKNDPRLSRVGAILEVTKFNEMPQLWNILKGEMSIVGPRPEFARFRRLLLGPLFSAPQASAGHLRAWPILFQERRRTLSKNHGSGAILP